MAAVNINDVASQLNTASRLVVSTDFFWVYMANGSQVKIPAEFARAYLIAGIKPTINDNGHWEIGGEDLGVVAVGKTPQFRGGTMGIEVSYDNGQTWSQVVAYTDIDPDLEALAAAYTKVTQGEADRVNAENTRNSNETARQNAETTRNNKETARQTAENTRNSNETARQTAETTRNNKETARQTAENTRNSNETSRQNAETTRNNQEATRVTQENTRQSNETTRNSNEETRKKQESTRQSQEAARVEAEKKRVTAENGRETAETARQNAEAARVKAEESRKAAESNRADAETKRTQSETDRSTHESQREEAETQRKANDTKRTADYQAIYDGLQAKSAEIDRMLASLQQQGSVAPMASIPARIATVEEVTVLAGATINVAPTDVQPITANRSMIYQIYSGDALVDAAGNVKTSTAGDIIVKVIPTLASGAARIVTIHAKEAEALTDESGNAITDENETEITC